MKYSKEAVCVFQESQIKGYVLFREFKEQKKKAIQLAKMYLAQHQNVSEAGIEQ